MRVKSDFSPGSTPSIASLLPDSAAHPPTTSARDSVEPGKEAAASGTKFAETDEIVEPSPPVDEEDLEDYRIGGYHPTDIGETFKDNRYVIVRKLGWGYFSTVWLAKDRHDNDAYVALKVVRASQNYTETAVDEIKLLKRLRNADPEHLGRDYVVALRDQFIHVGPNGAHVCMVFELLGENLLSLMKRYHYKGIPIVLVKQIMMQVLLAMDYTHRKCGMVHTDIKPENVLIRIFDVKRVIDEMEALLGENKQEQRDTFLHEQQIQQDEQKSSSVGSTGSVGTPESVDSSNFPGSMKRNQSFVRGSQPLTSPLTRPQSARGSTSSKSSMTGELSGDSSPAAAAAAANGAGTAKSRGSVPEVVVPDNHLQVSGDAPQPHRNTSRNSQPSGTNNKAKCPSECQRLHGGGLTALDEELVTVKIADFGSACSVDHHFTDDIQTRQYRAPEVLLGDQWGAGVDCWSVACMVFELLTGDYLFEPQSSTTYTKDEDHIAQIMELLGPMPPHMLQSKNARHFFDSRGRLRNIHNLKVWPLYDVFIGKYDYPPELARQLCDLLLPMLDMNPETRTDCGSLVHCDWLKDTAGFDDFEIDRDPSVPAANAVPGWSQEIVQTEEQAQDDLASSQRELNKMWIHGDTPSVPTPDPKQVVNEAGAQ